MRKKSPLTSNDDKITPLGKKKDQCPSLMAKGSNSDDSNPLFQSIKKKRILKKPESLLGRLRLESPLSSSPVFNLFNLIGLNQSSLRNPDSEESYFKTMFYMRVVERAELRRHALILQLKTTDQPAQPIQYLINRYKSFGDKRCYELALAMERTAVKLQQQRRQGFTEQLMRSFDGEPLSRFIDSMAGETYMCKVAPNRLVISRALLEMLGQDPEAYAIELCKYKAPLREIISAELYSQIMTKTLEHLGLLCDYMAGQLSHDELHMKTSVNFNDYIYDRHHKRIHCNFVLFMPTPQISCVQMREIIRESPRPGSRCPIAQRKSLMVDEHCQQRRFKEAEVLRNIVKLPEGLLKDNERRVAGYRALPQ